ncbi:MAG: TraR/DksA family transcriptional regulator [Elusimicrobiota bacterium]|nr:TraR/DksA family transcriptional regulator [Elusimicrobiota bacterium]
MAKKTAKKAASKGASKTKAKPAAKPVDTAAARAKAMAWLTPARLRDFRKELVAMRDDILRTVRKQKVDDVDNGDSVDQASQSIEKELMFELSDNERVTLEMIEAAIRKIDIGSFGICEATQKPISRARLEAIPYCRYSIEYQNQIEQKGSEAPESGPDFSTIGDFEARAES